MKKLNTALLFVGMVFLVYLVWRIGPGELGSQILDLGWGIIPIILSEGVGNLAHTMGWRHCIHNAAGTGLLCSKPLAVRSFWAWPLEWRSEPGRCFGPALGW